MAKKVLIIDDEPDMRLYLKTLFKKEGYETEVAENGDEGVRQAKAFRPDLITLDILMPRKSGVTAFEALRTTPELKDVPIIILTGLTRREDFFGERTDLREPEALVEKPIVRESFLKTVAELIGG